MMHGGTVAESVERATRSIAKRTMDVLLAAALLIPGIPLMLLGIALANVHNRSALFVQTRQGLAGRRFRIWKLRTMRRRQGKPGYEVTAVGKWLRATSIDELPQLFNVLCGDMSLVGPRPHPIILNRRYQKILPELSMRHAVKPGITGLAQISGARGPIRTVEDMRRRLQFDISYVREWSIILDLRILALTPARGVFPLVLGLFAAAAERPRWQRETAAESGERSDQSTQAPASGCAT